MNQPKQYELDGKTYWVIDDNTTFEIFNGNDDFDATSICDMCVDGWHPMECPTREALKLNDSVNACQIVILNDEGYAQYIAKRMGA